MSEAATHQSFLIATFIVTVLACVCGQGCDRTDAVKAESMVGKTKAQVLEALGKPETKWTSDLTILNPREYTQAEIDAWRETTESSGLVYDDVTVVFNVNDVVIKVEREP